MIENNIKLAAAHCIPDKLFPWIKYSNTIAEIGKHNSAIVEIIALTLISP